MGTAVLGMTEGPEEIRYLVCTVHWVLHSSSRGSPWGRREEEQRQQGAAEPSGAAGAPLGGNQGDSVLPQGMSEIMNHTFVLMWSAGLGASVLVAWLECCREYIKNVRKVDLFKQINAFPLFFPLAFVLPTGDLHFRRGYLFLPCMSYR